MLVATVHVAIGCLSVFREAAQRVVRHVETARSSGNGFVMRPDLDVLLEPVVPDCVAGRLDKLFCCDAPGRFLEGVLAQEFAAE